MTPISSENLLQALQWRYATKAFDATRKISPEDWAVLEQTLILTPSSFGLQPWKFIIITDQAVKESLVPVSWGQRQVADASHLVVFAVKIEVTEADITKYIQALAAGRGVTEASLEGFKNIILGFVANPPFGLTVKDWVTRQAYIALGNLMTSAAILEIDTCPMEGFDPAKYDEILGLAKLGLRSVVACPVGYRSAEDKYALVPKVRFPSADLVLKI